MRQVNLRFNVRDYSENNCQIFCFRAVIFKFLASLAHSTSVFNGLISVESLANAYDHSKGSPED